MRDREAASGLDHFRLVAALWVVAIHTSPLASFSADADFWFTRVLARLAVPFFLMTSGYFVLPGMLCGNRTQLYPARRFVIRTAILYGLAILLYLPLGFYAGHYRALTPADTLRMLLFDGTFYHLWYLPAAILGTLLLYGLSRKLPLRGVLAVSVILYLAGLLGDSYYGLVQEIPALNAVYSILFNCFGYTRNGLFYAPLFLSLGAALAQRRRTTPALAATGLLLSLAMMSLEGFCLRNLNWQRHDSMYLLLPAGAACLFECLLSRKSEPRPLLRRFSMWVYLLHPMAIPMVRAMARLMNLWSLLVVNSLGHYLAVCLVTLLLSWAALHIQRSIRPHGKCGRAWIELDPSALSHNVECLRALLPEHCRLMPVVKANAYGHGAVPLARALNRMDVDAFCVACVEEGVSLRKAGVWGEILILGYTHPDQLDRVRRWRLTQTVVDRDYAECLKIYGKRLRVHVAIDTGMHRLGERCENYEAIREIFAIENLRIDGMFTHLSAGDIDSAEARAFTRAQAAAFQALAERLSSDGVAIPKLHLQASHGALNYPELSADYARVGIALYGAMNEAKAAGLKPVLSLKARIAAVKTLEPGEHAGYGLDFKAPNPMKIAVVAIGYGDGLPRALSNGRGRMLINGHFAPIAGRVCMDQTLIDVTGIPDVQPGGVAVIIGQSGDLEITACDLAAQANTIPNEILSRLGPRLERNTAEVRARTA